MAALIHSYFPVYNDVANYTGSGTSIRSAGIVRNAEQAATIAALQHEGHLPMSHFALLKVPHEMFMMETEKSAKVKASREGGQVTSSSQADFDEDRTLSKVDEAASGFPRKIKAIGEDDEEDDKETDEKNRPEPGRAVFETTGKTAHPALPSLLGAGSGVYQSVAQATSGSLSGRNLSVLA